MPAPLLRTRWSAFGAAVAIALGAGGIGLVSATVTTGDRTVYVPITPCRIADTRPAYAVGLRTTPLGPAETYTVNAHGPQGQCNLPNDAVGLALNVTAANATTSSFLTFWGDGAQPNAANLNPQPGQPPTPNAVTTDLTSAGQFKVFNNKGTVDIIIDVNGYYADHTHDDRYYTEGEADARYVSALDDTFYYVPGSLLEIHFDDGPASVYFDNSSDAIVRKTGSTGDMQVLIPVPLPAELGGKWAKLINFRVSYRVNNVGSYIDHTWLVKSSNGGAPVVVGQSSADRASTAYTSYVVDCTDPGCQLAWAPNGNYVTVVLGLRYGGTGGGHDITIGGVLMRVAYVG